MCFKNQTTSGCCNCRYYNNGFCSYADSCYGTQMRVENGKVIVEPVKITITYSNTFLNKNS